ncbi:MAG: T9SS type A sorting domain-containing protein [Flavobacteriales bacterium]|nr:T9SS type A sorting domain-containing protein [Flavobacteriales bacterium]MDW8347926.1 hypothetical protein [Bacteroidia bacterium]
MNRYMLFIIIFYLLLTSKAGGQSIFEKKYSASTNDMVTRIITTHEGGAILSGKSNSFSLNDNHFLLKVDSMGMVKWAKWYGPGNAGINSITAISSGKYVCAGYGPENNFTKAILFCVDTQGSTLWSKAYNTLGSYWEATDIIMGLDNKLVMAGYAVESGDINPFICKLDTNGNVLAFRYDKSISSANNKIFAICQLPDSSYFGVGEIEGTQPNIYCIAPNKNLISVNPKIISRGNLPGGRARAIQLTNGGDVIIAGEVNVGGTNGIDILLMKINPLLQNSSHIKWVKTFGGTGTDLLVSLKRRSTGDYIACGKSNSYGNSYQGILIEFDSLGNILLARQVGQGADEACQDITEIPGGQTFITGITSTTQDDIFLSRIHPHDTTCWMIPLTFSVTDRTSEYSFSSPGATSQSFYLTTNIVLNDNLATISENDLCPTTTLPIISLTDKIMSISPNPSFGNIQLQIGRSFSKITLRIGNVFGQPILHWEIPVVEEGETISLQGKDLPTGIYFVHFLQHNQLIATEKIMIIRDNDY